MLRTLQPRFGGVVTVETLESDDLAICQSVSDTRQKSSNRPAPMSRITNPPLPRRSACRGGREGAIDCEFLVETALGANWEAVFDEDGIDELADSINKLGIHWHWLVLVCGHRRIRAS
jgi:hypothetical protein